MPNGLEIMKAAIDDFEEIQEYMFLAKKRECHRNIWKIEKEVSLVKSYFKCFWRESHWNWQNQRVKVNSSK